jgi:thiosulfate dehydrogenase
MGLRKIQDQVAALVQLKNKVVVLQKTYTAILMISLAAFALSYQSCKGDQRSDSRTADSVIINSVWVGSSFNQIPYYSREDGQLIYYGYELIAHTSRYLGPKGSVMQISNGMNCQNCHLDAGTKPWGNNYGAVYTTYPKFRDRSGSLETIHKRVNDCFERSLNGKALDSNSTEMKAIYAYIKWLGEDLQKGTKPKGSGIAELPFMNRAADPEKGKAVYVQKCQTCHGADGSGMMNLDGTMYQYPPLWGPHSYNSGAGLFRLSRFAGYVKNNMPQGADYHLPQLSNEEAWDVAAFVNSQPRPSKDLSKDWPDISKKPVDHPFGPYADPFNEHQHKYGPYGPIKDYKEEHQKKKSASK